MRQSFSSAATAGINNVASPPAMPSFPSDSFLFPTSNDCNNENNASISASATQGESRLDNASQSDRALLHLKQHYLHECFQMDHLHVPQTPAAFEHDHDREGELESHEDSFYASLMAAQQLRRQRETTARGSAVDTTTATASVALRSHASSALSASTVGSPCLSPPPRTLQELLTWRQEMLDARMREHAVWQQQQQQQHEHHPSFSSLHDSLEFSWSLRSPGQLEESFPWPPRSATAVVTPETPALPAFLLASHGLLAQGSPAPSPLTPKGAHAPTILAVSGEMSSEVPVSKQRAESAEADLHPLPPTPTSTQKNVLRPVVPPLRSTEQTPFSHSSTPASATLPFRTTAHSSDAVATPATLEAVSQYIQEHDADVRQNTAARSALFLLLLLALMVMYEGLFLPGGAWGAVTWWFQYIL